MVYGWCGGIESVGVVEVGGGGGWWWWVVWWMVD